MLWQIVWRKLMMVETLNLLHTLYFFQNQKSQKNSDIRKVWTQKRGKTKRYLMASDTVGKWPFLQTQSKKDLFRSKKLQLDISIWNIETNAVKLHFHWL
jgi:hypothetical protein